MKLRNRWQLSEKEMAAAGWTLEDREEYRRVFVPKVQEDIRVWKRENRRERWKAGALAVVGVLIALVTLLCGLYWLGGGGGWTTALLLVLITLTVIVVRRWPQAWRDRFNTIVVYTLIAGFFTLMLTDAALQGRHHPVKLPLIGWIGDPKPPADPGDCDATSSCRP
jgi:uncharacterized membrane protein YphA (DoxX/SURF4 family)